MKEEGREGGRETGKEWGEREGGREEWMDVIERTPRHEGDEVNSPPTAWSSH